MFLFQQGKGVFQGFSGFGSLNNNATDFGTSTPATKPLTGFFSLASSSKNMFSGLNKPTTEASSSNQNGCKSNSSEESKTTKAQGSSYEDNLKALNESIVAWIQKHLNTNPFVDLSPIFDDYKQHMKNIDSKFSNSTTAAANSSSTKSVTFSASSQPAESSFSPFSGPPPPQASQETQGNKSNTLNTGENNLFCIICLQWICSLGGHWVSRTAYLTSHYPIFCTKQLNTSPLTFCIDI